MKLIRKKMKFKEKVKTVKALLKNTKVHKNKKRFDSFFFKFKTGILSDGEVLFENLVNNISASSCAGP